MKNAECCALRERVFDMSDGFCTGQLVVMQMGAYVDVRTMVHSSCRDAFTSITHVKEDGRYASA